jgi:hypothetical protein
MSLAFLPGCSWLAFDIDWGRFVDLLLVVLHCQIEGAFKVVNGRKADKGPIRKGSLGRVLDRKGENRPRFKKKEPSYDAWRWKRRGKEHSSA